MNKILIEYCSHLWYMFFVLVCTMQKENALEKNPKSSILQKEIDDWKVKVENHKYVPRISNRGLAKIYANRKYIMCTFVKLERVTLTIFFISFQVRPTFNFQPTAITQLI